MLVLTRLVGESLMIGDDIRVTVMAAEPTRARLQVLRASAPVATAADVISDAWHEVNVAFTVLPEVSCRVVRIHGVKVRLGVVAPRTMAVSRKEFHDRLRWPKSERPD